MGHSFGSSDGVNFGVCGGPCASRIAKTAPPGCEIERFPAAATDHDNIGSGEAADARVAGNDGPTRFRDETVNFDRGKPHATGPDWSLETKVN